MRKLLQLILHDDTSPDAIRHRRVAWLVRVLTLVAVMVIGWTQEAKAWGDMWLIGNVYSSADWSKDETTKMTHNGSSSDADWTKTVTLSAGTYIFRFGRASSDYSGSDAGYSDLSSSSNKDGNGDGLKLSAGSDWNNISITVEDADDYDFHVTYDNGKIKLVITASTPISTTTFGINDGSTTQTKAASNSATFTLRPTAETNLNFSIQPDGEDATTYYIKGDAANKSISSAGTYGYELTSTASEGTSLTLATGLNYTLTLSYDNLNGATLSVTAAEITYKTTQLYLFGGNTSDYGGWNNWNSNKSYPLTDNGNGTASIIIARPSSSSSSTAGNYFRFHDGSSQYGGVSNNQAVTVGSTDGATLTKDVENAFFLSGASYDTGAGSYITLTVSFDENGTPTTVSATQSTGASVTFTPSDATAQTKNATPTTPATFTFHQATGTTATFSIDGTTYGLAADETKTTPDEGTTNYTLSSAADHQSMTLSANTTYTLKVYSDGKLTVTAEADYYNVLGTENVTGYNFNNGSWTNSVNRMTNNGDGTYSLTFSNVTLSGTESDNRVQIIKNGAYANGQWPSSSDQNIPKVATATADNEFTEAGTYTVTVNFDSTTGTISFVIKRGAPEYLYFESNATGWWTDTNVDDANRVNREEDGEGNYTYTYILDASQYDSAIKTDGNHILFRFEDNKRSSGVGLTGSNDTNPLLSTSQTSNEQDATYVASNIQSGDNNAVIMYDGTVLMYTITATFNPKTSKWTLKAETGAKAPYYNLYYSGNGSTGTVMHTVGSDGSVSFTIPHEAYSSTDGVSFYIWKTDPTSDPATNTYYSTSSADINMGAGVLLTERTDGVEQSATLTLAAQEASNAPYGSMVVTFNPSVTTGTNTTITYDTQTVGEANELYLMIRKGTSGGFHRVKMQATRNRDYDFANADAKATGTQAADNQVFQNVDLKYDDLDRIVGTVGDADIVQWYVVSGGSTPTYYYPATTRYMTTQITDGKWSDTHNGAAEHYGHFSVYLVDENTAISTSFKGTTPGPGAYWQFTKNALKTFNGSREPKSFTFLMNVPYQPKSGDYIDKAKGGFAFNSSMWDAQPSSSTGTTEFAAKDSYDDTSTYHGGYMLILNKTSLSNGDSGVGSADGSVPIFPLGDNMKMSRYCYKNNIAYLWGECIPKTATLRKSGDHNYGYYITTDNDANTGSKHDTGTPGSEDDYITYSGARYGDANFATNKARSAWERYKTRVQKRAGYKAEDLVPDSIVYRATVQKPENGWGGLYIAVVRADKVYTPDPNNVAYTNSNYQEGDQNNSNGGDDGKYYRQWTAWDNGWAIRPQLNADNKADQGYSLDARALQGGLTTARRNQSLNPNLADIAKELYGESATPNNNIGSYIFSMNVTTTTYRLVFNRTLDNSQITLRDYGNQHYTFSDKSGYVQWRGKTVKRAVAGRTATEYTDATKTTVKATHNYRFFTCWYSSSSYTLPDGVEMFTVTRFGKRDGEETASLTLTHLTAPTIATDDVNEDNATLKDGNHKYIYASTPLILVYEADDPTDDGTDNFTAPSGAKFNKQTEGSNALGTLSFTVDQLSTPRIYDPADEEDPNHKADGTTWDPDDDDDQPYQASEFTGQDDELQLSQVYYFGDNLENKGYHWMLGQNAASRISDDPGDTDDTQNMQLGFWLVNGVSITYPHDTWLNVDANDVKDYHGLSTASINYDGILTTTNARRMPLFFIDWNFAPTDTATGITDVAKKPRVANGKDEWYTLQGIRVNKPSVNGVYIHNGKKVIVK